jgi:hypothetical protein
MDKTYKPVDLSGIKSYSLDRRISKVDAASFAQPWKKNMTLRAFLDSLSDILAGRDLRNVIAALHSAHQNDKTVILGMGAHVIKVGLNPIIIDLMERGLISCVAMNGAGIIHDLEIAMTGQTSEDVASALDDGTFGMASDTVIFLSAAIADTADEKLGLGQAVGRAIAAARFPLADKSILAAGWRLNIPVTVHVAIGTDIFHMHPQFDPALTASGSHLDFRLLTAIVADLEGGVYLNVGSAVILPEVFLKAVAIARNLGHRLDQMTTVNIDFNRQYRPMTNVLQRPTARGGQGIHLSGHHEILLPLIAAGLIEQLD